MMAGDSPLIESVFNRRSVPAGFVFWRWLAPDRWSHRAFHWPATGSVRGSLLFQSGRGDFIEKYLEACAYWHARQWDVQGFDWRGQGGSGRIAAAPKVGEHNSLDPLVDDLIAFVSEWRDRTPAPHVIVAHSMGGYIALQACVEKGLMFDSAILVAPMLAVQTARIPLKVARATVSIARATGFGARPAWRDNVNDPKRYLRLTSSWDRYEDSQWWKAHRPELAMGPPSWNWLAAALNGSTQLMRPGTLETVRIPFLLMTAGLDRLVDNEASRLAARRLPDAQVINFPGARHELLREADDIRQAAFHAMDVFFNQRATHR